MAEALLSIQILPKTAAGEDIIPYVDRAIEIIRESGVPYRVGPLETTMEGSLDELLTIVKKMNAAMFEMGCPQVMSHIKLLISGSGEASIDRLLEKYPDGR
ncbi:MAG: hypothetical protein BAA02_13140 [Paenibacillaceae bacterium ZCTH02-B3]|nr:MAG: hypothetical protein BAA02_13140 [Paenibacillaceae bacterium ZCTH02-B3]